MKLKKGNRLPFSFWIMLGIAGFGLFVLGLDFLLQLNLFESSESPNNSDPREKQLEAEKKSCRIKHSGILDLGADSDALILGDWAHSNKSLIYVFNTRSLESEIHSVHIDSKGRVTVRRISQHPLICSESSSQSCFHENDLKPRISEVDFVATNHKNFLLQFNYLRRRFTIPAFVSDGGIAYDYPIGHCGSHFSADSQFEFSNSSSEYVIALYPERNSLNLFRLRLSGQRPSLRFVPKSADQLWGILGRMPNRLKCHEVGDPIASFRFQDNLLSLVIREPLFASSSALARVDTRLRTLKPIKGPATVDLNGLIWPISSEVLLTAQSTFMGSRKKIKAISLLRDKTAEMEKFEISELLTRPAQLGSPEQAVLTMNSRKKSALHFFDMEQFEFLRLAGFGRDHIRQMIWRNQDNLKFILSQNEIDRSIAYDFAVCGP